MGQGLPLAMSGCHFPVTSGSLYSWQREVQQAEDSPPTKSRRCWLLGMKAHSFHSFQSEEGGGVSQHLLWSHFLPHGGHLVNSGWLLASDRCIQRTEHHNPTHYVNRGQNSTCFAYHCIPGTGTGSTHMHLLDNESVHFPHRYSVT